MKGRWIQKPLGEVCTLQRGFDLPKKNRLQGPIPLMSASGQIDTHSVAKVAGPGVVTGRSGSVGGVFFVEDDFWPLNTTLYVKDFHGNDHRFVYYLLASFDLARFTSGAGVPTLNRNSVHRELVRIPIDVEEQKRIVAILDEAFAGIEAAIANTQKNLVNNRELLESYLNTTFRKGRGGWTEKPLNDVCEFSSGGTPSKRISRYWEGDIPWVSGRDMKSTQLFDSQLHISNAAVNESAARLAPAGSLLVLVRGMGLAHGAQVAELMVPCAFNQDIKGVHPGPNLIPRFLVFMLRHRINLSTNVLSKAAHGTLKINTDAMRNVSIFVPPWEQQVEIVSKIDELKEETQRLDALYRQKLAALGELKQSLLHKAFSGELTAEKAEHELQVAVA